MINTVVLECWGATGIYRAADIKYGKRSLKHLGPKTWDCIDPTLYELSSFTFKKRYRDNLIAAY